MKTRMFIPPACLLAATLFTTMQPSAYAAEGYHKQIGDFIKLERSSGTDPKARSLLASPPADKLILKRDNQQVTLQPTDSYRHLTAFSGRMKTEDDDSIEDVIVVQSAQGGFLVFWPDSQKFIYQSAEGEQTLLTVDNNSPLKTGVLKDETVKAAAMPTSESARSLNPLATAKADIDAEGNYVIDLLVGFSSAAAKVAIDPEAFAFAQVESVNQAFKNSQIEGIKIRLVGIQIVDKDYPVNNEYLSEMTTLFAKGIEKYSPDIIAGFFVGDKALDNAVAWAYIGGSSMLLNVASPTALRHEIGHNAGGHHCSSATTSGYAYGWDNGMSQTIMCGNTTGYYSNPALNDKFGLPLGNSEKANMARVWQEAKVRMSSTRPAAVPLNNAQMTLLAEESLNLNAQNGYKAGLEFKIPDNVEKVLISTVYGARYLEKGKFTLEVYSLDESSSANSSGYIGSSTAYAPIFTLSQPVAGGVFQANLQSNRLDLEDIQLRVWALPHDVKNGGAESGDLSGWTVSSGQMRVVDTQDNILPAEGNYFFTARESFKEANYADVDEMLQTIDINPLALTSSATATLTFKSNGWGDGDKGTVFLWAKDKDGTTLAGNQVDTLGKKQQWLDYSVNVPLPAGTTQVEIQVKAYPVAGGMNDVHFDNFRFTVNY